MSTKCGWGCRLRKNKDDIAKLGVLIACLFLFFTSTQQPTPSISPPICTDYNLLLDTYQNVLIEKGSTGGCFGSYRFYSGKGFMYDLENMESKYQTLASSEIGNPISPFMTLNPPASSVLVHVDDTDCEDFSFWTYCLAAMYPNVNCDIYYAHYWDGDHIGMDCMECYNGTCLTKRI